MTVQALEITANMSNGFGFVEMNVDDLDPASEGGPVRMSPETARAVALGLFEAAVRAELLEESNRCGVSSPSGVFLCDRPTGHDGHHGNRDTAATDWAHWPTK